MRRTSFQCGIAWSGAVALILSLSPMAVASTVDETDLDVTTREISKTLRCTVCQTESIWESGAPLAAQMRAVIRERLAQGQSPDEIRAYFYSRYGDYILMQPPKRGMHWIIWTGPFAVLAIGGLFLYLTLSRWVIQTPIPPPELSEPLDESSRKRLERELHS